MYDEQTVVIKDKSFTDIAVKELADTKARLMMYKYYHAESSAKKLPLFQKFEACYEQMNDYDRMRVDKTANDLFAVYLGNPDGFMPYKALKRKYFKIWLLCTFFTIIIISLIIHPPYPPTFTLSQGCLEECILTYFWLFTVPTSSGFVVWLLSFACPGFHEDLRFAKAREMFSKFSDKTEKEIEEYGKKS